MTQLKLTEKSVLALVPPAEGDRLYVWDVECRGFGVQVGRRQRTFVVRGRANGQLVKRTIGAHGSMRADGHAWTVQLARIEARRLLGELAGGKILPPRTHAGGPTLRAGLELHVSNMRAGKNRRRRACSPRSIQKMETEVPRHLGDWLDRPIVELTAAELQKVLDRIERDTPRRADAVNKPGAAQANKVLAHVSAIWNALDKLHDLPGRNPAKRLSPSALKPREARIADDGFVDWYARVMAMENAVRRDMQLVALFTGLRSDSVRHLRWEDVDEERALLHVRKAKGDKPYTLPLVATVRDILQRRHDDNPATFDAFGGDGGWCFPSLSRELKPVRGEDGRSKLVQVVQPIAEPKERRADPSKLDEDGEPVLVSYLPGIHASRRTFNSVAIEIGIPPEARLALMNHEGKGVNAKHYGLPQNWDYLRECAGRIEAALWARLKPDPDAKAKTARSKMRAV
jgi:integrase